MSRLQSAVLWTLLCCLFLAPATGECQSPPVRRGVITNLKGTVTVRRGSDAREASLGFVLLPGDTIFAEQNASCSGISPLGNRFELGPTADSGTLSFPLSESTSRGHMAPWIVERMAAWEGDSDISLSPVRSGDASWKYETEVGKPIVPAAGGSVRPGRSLFAWSVDEGIESYDVTISRDQGKAVHLTVKDHTMVKDDLEPGGTYYWRVTPKVEGWQRIPQWVPFTVMTDKTDKELDASIADMPDLEAGFVLLSLGLHGEAIQRFDAAASIASTQKAALTWRAKALAGMGLYEEAYNDLRDAAAVK